MHISKNIKILRRGARVATRVALAEIRRNLALSLASTEQNPAGFVVMRTPDPNPGRLRALTYLPSGRRVRAGGPLVVLLHGCGQDAAGFAVNAGWTALADQLGLPLLLPEQQGANNQQRCFQWFEPENIARGEGEAASIAALVRAAMTRFDVKPEQVFIAGMSAGGAMAAAMLAAYPDLFAAGAVAAGLPVGDSRSPMAALSRMARGGPERSAEDWAALARQVGPNRYDGPWPRLSIWHGGRDETVVPANGDDLAAQWRALHRLPDTPTEAADGHLRWGDKVELWRLADVGHAWPVEAGAGALAYHTADSAIPAVPAIARFWGLRSGG